MDGAPDLGNRGRYATWAQVLGEEYEELVARVHAGRRTDIDDYGATNPPEFFAVVTEMFFEKPAQLRARHPELYDTLADFYQQDPASFVVDGPHLGRGELVDRLGAQRSVHAGEPGDQRAGRRAVGILGHHLPPGRVQDHRPRPAVEERLVQVALQCAHAQAHGGRGEADFVSGSREAAEARHREKRAQRADGGQAAAS